MAGGINSELLGWLIVGFAVLTGLASAVSCLGFVGEEKRIYFRYLAGASFGGFWALLALPRIPPQLSAYANPLYALLHRFGAKFSKGVSLGLVQVYGDFLTVLLAGIAAGMLLVWVMTRSPRRREL